MYKIALFAFFFISPIIACEKTNVEDRDIVSICAAELPKIFQIQNPKAPLKSQAFPSRSINDLIQDLSRYHQSLIKGDRVNCQLDFLESWRKKRKERQQLTQDLFKKRYGLENELLNFIDNEDLSTAHVVLKEYSTRRKTTTYRGIETPTLSSFYSKLEKKNLFAFLMTTALSENFLFVMTGLQRLLYLTVSESFKICLLNYYDTFLHKTGKKLQLSHEDSRESFKKWKDEASTMSQTELMNALKKTKSFNENNFPVFYVAIPHIFNQIRFITIMQQDEPELYFSYLVPLMFYQCEIIPQRRFIDFDNPDNLASIDLLRQHYLYWNMMEDFKKTLYEFYHDSMMFFPLSLSFQAGEGKCLMQLTKTHLSKDLVESVMKQTNSLQEIPCASHAHPVSETLKQTLLYCLDLAINPLTLVYNSELTEMQTYPFGLETGMKQKEQRLKEMTKQIIKESHFLLNNESPRMKEITREIAKSDPVEKLPKKLLDDFDIEMQAAEEMLATARLGNMKISDSEEQKIEQQSDIIVKELLRDNAQKKNEMRARQVDRRKEKDEDLKKQEERMKEMVSIERQNYNVNLMQRLFAFLETFIKEKQEYEERLRKAPSAKALEKAQKKLIEEEKEKKQSAKKEKRATSSKGTKKKELTNFEKQEQKKHLEKQKKEQERQKQRERQKAKSEEKKEEQEVPPLFLEEVAKKKEEEAKRLKKQQDEKEALEKEKRERAARERKQKIAQLIASRENLIEHLEKKHIKFASSTDYAKVLETFTTTNTNIFKAILEDYEETHPLSTHERAEDVMAFLYLGSRSIQMAWKNSDWEFLIMTKSHHPAYLTWVCGLIAALNDYSFTFDKENFYPPFIENGRAIKGSMLLIGTPYDFAQYPKAILERDQRVKKEGETLVMDDLIGHVAPVDSQEIEAEVFKGVSWKNLLEHEKVMPSMKSNEKGTPFFHHPNAQQMCGVVMPLLYRMDHCFFGNPKLTQTFFYEKQRVIKEIMEKNDIASFNAYELKTVQFFYQKFHAKKKLNLDNPNCRDHFYRPLQIMLMYKPLFAKVYPSLNMNQFEKSLALLKNYVAFLRMNEKGYEKIFFMQNIYPHYNALISLLRDGVIADVWLRP